MKNENIIEVNNLSKTFNLEAGFFAKNKQNVYAVNDVSFAIKRGTTYGLAGESGCGISTGSRAHVRGVSPSGRRFYLCRRKPCR